MVGNRCSIFLLYYTRKLATTFGINIGPPPLLESRNEDELHLPVVWIPPPMSHCSLCPPAIAFLPAKLLPLLPTASAISMPWKSLLPCCFNLPCIHSPRHHCLTRRACCLAKESSRPSMGSRCYLSEVLKGELTHLAELEEISGALAALRLAEAASLLLLHRHLLEPEFCCCLAWALLPWSTTGTHPHHVFEAWTKLWGLTLIREWNPSASKYSNILN